MLQSPPRIPRSWGGHGVSTAPVYAPAQGLCELIAYGDRLIAVVEGRSGGKTEFVYDTGTSLTTVSACSPLASEVHFARGDSITVGPHDGTTGVVTEFRLGGIVCRLLPVAVLEERHTRADPRNLLGGVPGTSIDLLHDAARHSWWLQRDGSRPLFLSAGERRVRLVDEGIPVVRLEDPRGRGVYALIDTGAPRSHASKRSGLVGVPLTLKDELGRVVLVVEPEEEIDWALSVDHRPIDCYIGLDDLARSSWMLSVDEGLWRFAPVAARDD